jgi:DNA-binding CsgD family transcriptional regulator
MIKVEVVNKGPLTDRESEVLAMICEGKPDKTIANILAISTRGVEAHTAHIYEKLNVRNAVINARCAAISASVARGMIKLSTHAICAWLIFGAIHMDDQAVRCGRGRMGRATVVRQLEI